MPPVRQAQIDDGYVPCVQLCVQPYCTYSYDYMRIVVFHEHSIELIGNWDAGSRTGSAE